MTKLYKPEAFEPLTDTPWNAARVTDGIQAIVEAAESAHDKKELWPAGERESCAGLDESSVAARRASAWNPRCVLICEV
jgi:hypothetical protein